MTLAEECRAWMEGHGLAFRAAVCGIFADLCWDPQTAGRVEDPLKAIEMGQLRNAEEGFRFAVEYLRGSNFREIAVPRTPRTVRGP